jgi:hypothetical protein
MSLDWVKYAKQVFDITKPEHFTNYNHCDECAEHDEVLLKSSIDSIGLKELGNPAWDPIFSCSNEGKKYYMPSFIRLSIETMNKEFYFEQFLVHLESDGLNNALFQACNQQQRECIAEFVEHVIINHTSLLVKYNYEHKAMRVHEIWSL